MIDLNVPGYVSSLLDRFRLFRQREAEKKQAEDEAREAVETQNAEYLASIKVQKP